MKIVRKLLASMKMVVAQIMFILVEYMNIFYYNNRCSILLYQTTVISALEEDIELIHVLT